MSYEEEKREAAMRLFDALSGVDEAYLAACEEDNCNCNSNSSSSRMAVFVRRYGRSVAAVFALAVLGASLLIYQTGNGRDKTAQSTDRAGGIDGAFTNGAMLEDAAVPEAVQEPMAGFPVQADTGEEEGARAEDAASCALQSVGGAIQEEKQELTGREAAYSDSVEMDNYKKITQLEAAKLAVVGDYLPDVWPTHGSISQISCDDTAGEETLTIHWSYGDNIDGFELSILNMEDAQSIEVADVSKPESYDERLYRVSHGEMVPEEYGQVYADAVFREEEFTKECVEARIVAYLNDNGDTVSFRGRFGVLYQTEDGKSVLVRFNGRGTVDEIWEMMKSIDG